MPHGFVDKLPERFVLVESTEGLSSDLFTILHPKPRKHPVIAHEEQRGNPPPPPGGAAPGGNVDRPASAQSKQGGLAFVPDDVQREIGHMIVEGVAGAVVDFWRRPKLGVRNRLWSPAVPQPQAHPAATAAPPGPPPDSSTDDGKTNMGEAVEGPDGGRADVQGPVVETPQPPEIFRGRDPDGGQVFVVFRGHQGP